MEVELDVFPETAREEDVGTNDSQFSSIFPYDSDLRHGGGAVKRRQNKNHWFHSRFS